MKQSIFIFVIAGLMSYGCATSKKVADISVGEWDYVIKDTPNGDMAGTFTISKAGDQYSGMLRASGGNSPLNNVKVENDVLSSTFDYSGYTVSLTGKFMGDNFDGKCSVDYNDFQMTAVRKK